MSLQSDANNIVFMETTPGWKKYRIELQIEYQRYYDKLLDCSSADINNIRGIVKGLKIALELPEIIKGRG